MAVVNRWVAGLVLHAAVVLALASESYLWGTVPFHHQDI
jgi:hypothetical protein